jgi:glutaredoxin-related protein
MPRPVLDESQIHPAIRHLVATHQQDIVREVMTACQQHPVVVVGMGMNPFCKKACQALTQAGQSHQYLEYGNYFNTWRTRNALKMWTGWPTFPMVFVKGTLVGGYREVKSLIDSGELARMLAGAARSA